MSNDTDLQTLRVLIAREVNRQIGSREADVLSANLALLTVLVVIMCVQALYLLLTSDRCIRYFRNMKGALSRREMSAASSSAKASHPKGARKLSDNDATVESDGHAALGAVRDVMED